VPHGGAVPGDHAGDRQDALHLGDVLGAGHRAHEDVLDQLAARAVPVQVQPESEGGVQEQLTGRQPQQHLRVARVDADVAAVLGFAAQGLDQLLRVGERLTEHQPTPAEVERRLGVHASELVLRRWLPGRARDRRDGRQRPPAELRPRDHGTPPRTAVPLGEKTSDGAY
jgi:hypothetical protein